MDKQKVATLEKIYDQYCSMIYGIALQFSTSPDECEVILIKVFQQVHAQNLINKPQHCLCASLIKLTIQIAKKRTQPHENFILSQFESTPLLNKVFCTQITLQEYGIENSLTVIETAKQMHEEFNLIFRTNSTLKSI